MLFHLGALPESPDFLPDNGWTPLREPSPWVAQLFALPIGFVASIALGFLWLLLTPLKLEALDSPGIMLISMVVLVPIHELIHAAAHPYSGVSTSSILGFWPSRLIFYAHYLGELSRSRFIAILLMPMLIISVLPLIVCAITSQSSALLAYASTLNALFACVDMLGTGLLLCQVPSNATLRNQGWRTYWRIDDSNAG